MRSLLLIVAVIWIVVPAAPMPAFGEDARFSICAELPYRNCVHSGELIYLRGEPIRLADVVSPDRYMPGCPAASNISWYAAIRLRDLLNQGTFELIEPEDGGHGEPRRRIERYGKSLGDVLVAEGLARRRTAGPPDWCDE